MSYTYQVEPKEMFKDRYEEFVSFGIPVADVEELRATITDMWADAPGGWSYEWSVFARRYHGAGKPLLAAVAYGFAKFPCLANQARVTAQDNQIACYLEAAPSFPVKFERRTVAVTAGGQSFGLPVHLFSASGQFAGGPVFLLSGGVDGYKMDLHGIAVALCQRLGMTVLAFDIAGTGECPIPLTVEGGDAIIVAMAKEARQIGNGKVAYMGFSFGGNFSAMAGLTSVVDAAIVLGGPVDRSFTMENAGNLPYGMPGIIGNDMHYDHEPSLEEFVAGMAQFSRQALLAQPENAPMLIINGANDYFVPLADTLVFAGRAKTDVHVLGDCGHCALLSGDGGRARMQDVINLVTAWLPEEIGSPAP
jgi:esterase FrsA